MIEQQKGTRVCGQVAVAHLAGVSLEESVATFGHRHGTKVREVIGALEELGYDVPWPRLQKTPRHLPLPRLAIGKLRWRLPSGRLRGWHWVAIIGGKVLDGLEHSRPGEVTSVIICHRREPKYGKS